MTDSTQTLPPEKKLESVMSWLATDVANAAAPADPELARQADQVVDTLLSIDPQNASSLGAQRQVFEKMGTELQRESARRSAMLKQPVDKLYQQATEGGDVANALVDLKVKVEELDPGQFDLEAGWMTRTLGRLPFVGTPMKRYFTRYESSRTVLDAIVRSLKQGRDQLMRDNLTLADDQQAMRAVSEKLEKAIKLGQIIDAKLSTKLERELTPGDARHTFVQTEWLFPLRQRIQDLQQQLIVNQQGVLSIDLIIKNNNELARGVERAVNVTVSALQVAVTLALALANQRITLERVQAVNETTDRLIASSAEKLRTQGVEIHKMAASTQLNMDTLKKAFADIRAALDDVSRFRQEALPQMAANIAELDKLSTEAARAIAQSDDGKRVGAQLAQQMGATP
ncbi:MAG TPA: toxic anion resistance protein [Burkholderiaceae bacterium]|nr:toxic anion resistance protein [Burkholderiaceae bacterium]